MLLLLLLRHCRRVMADDAALPEDRCGDLGGRHGVCCIDVKGALRDHRRPRAGGRFVGLTFAAVPVRFALVPSRLPL
jgi:hypothetical protein